jgi:hypothetical protein
LRLPPPSATFHGRDVLAPIAAALACRTPVKSLGPVIARAPLAERPDCVPRPGAGPQSARVLHIDGFGNIITNIPLRATPARVSIGAYRITQRAATYADAPARSLALVPGSSGFWEIARRNAAAAARVPAHAGMTFTWYATLP